MHASALYAVFAAHPTTLDKLRHVPTDSWINLAIFVISIVVIYKMWRTLRSLNDYAPYIAIGVVATCVFFYWVYTRTEPSFLSPVVERIAPFFPSRSQQQEYVDRAKTHRES